MFQCPYFKKNWFNMSFMCVLTLTQSTCFYYEDTWHPTSKINSPGDISNIIKTARHGSSQLYSQHWGRGITISLGQLKVYSEFQVGLEPVSGKQKQKIIKIERKIVWNLGIFPQLSWL